MNLIRAKQRVVDQGEVFTPVWIVDAMPDFVGGKAERIESRLLEPTCGSGNSMERILQCKVADVEVE
jgi:type I restriction-modification system DNA methylase subunit